MNSGGDKNSILVRGGGGGGGGGETLAGGEGIFLGVPSLCI